MSNTTFPDTRAMLPSQARAALTSHLIARLEAAPLNCYADPMYEYAHVLSEAPAELDGYAWSVLHDCWLAARELYETRHPKRQHYSTPDDCVAYREGIPVNG